MKKHLSILALWVRSTFWGAAGILLLTAAAELGLMGLKLGAVRSREIQQFASLVAPSQSRLLYAAGLTLLWAWLLWMGCAAKRNTLGRLNVSEEAVALWHGVCCTGWLVIFWCAQIGVVLVGYWMFLGAADPASVSGQTLYLACYQDNLLHWLLPLDDLWTAAGVTLTTLILGFATAVDSYRQRRGRSFLSSLSPIPWATAALGPVFGNGKMPLVLLAVITFIVIPVAINSLYKGWKEGGEI